MTNKKSKNKSKFDKKKKISEREKDLDQHIEENGFTVEIGDDYKNIEQDENPDDLLVRLSNNEVYDELIKNKIHYSYVDKYIKETIEEFAKEKPIIKIDQPIDYKEIEITEKTFDIIKDDDQDKIEENGKDEPDKIPYISEPLIDIEIKNVIEDPTKIEYTNQYKEESSSSSEEKEEESESSESEEESEKEEESKSSDSTSESIEEDSDFSTSSSESTEESDVSDFNDIDEHIGVIKTINDRDLDDINIDDLDEEEREIYNKLYTKNKYDKIEITIPIKKEVKPHPSFINKFVSFFSSAKKDNICMLNVNELNKSIQYVEKGFRITEQSTPIQSSISSTNVSNTNSSTNYLNSYYKFRTKPSS